MGRGQGFPEGGHFLLAFGVQNAVPDLAGDVGVGNPAEPEVFDAELSSGWRARGTILAVAWGTGLQEERPTRGRGRGGGRGPGCAGRIGHTHEEEREQGYEARVQGEGMGMVRRGRRGLDVRAGRGETARTRGRR